MRAAPPSTLLTPCTQRPGVDEKLSSFTPLPLSHDPSRPATAVPHAQDPPGAFSGPRDPNGGLFCPPFSSGSASGSGARRAAIWRQHAKVCRRSMLSRQMHSHPSAPALHAIARLVHSSSHPCMPRFAVEAPILASHWQLDRQQTSGVSVPPHLVRPIGGYVSPPKVCQRWSPS